MSTNSEFRGGKLNFTTLYCCFCKKTSFSQASLIFVLEQPFSDPETVLVFSRIVLRWGRNNRYNFYRHSAEIRLLGVKGTEQRKVLFFLKKIGIHSMQG